MENSKEMAKDQRPGIRYLDNSFKVGFVESVVAPATAIGGSTAVA